MKRIAVLTAMLLVVCCVTFVLAQEQPAPMAATKSAPPSKTVRSEKAMTFWGEVVSVDTTVNAVTVKSKSGKTETVKVDPRVVVKKAGKVIPLNSLTAGNKISLAYKMVNGEKIATSITERVAPEKKETGSRKKGTTSVPR
jgi:ABC-type glycerol-3-phosphate transport system substrate-binding protein